MALSMAAPTPVRVPLTPVVQQRQPMPVGWDRHQRAGGVLAAYMCQSFVVTPFDRVKTLLQASSTRQSAFPVVRHLVRNGGLYRGLSYELAGAPFAVLYFTLYEEGSAYARSYGYSDAAATATAAVAARSCEMSLRAPLELLKTRAQAGGASTGRSLGELYRGFSLLAGRDLSFSLVYWSAYEPLRRYAVATEASSAVVGFGAGAVAGCVAAFVTTPLDVLKTRRQAGDDRSAARVASALWREGGVAGLFAGVGPRLLRLPAGLATFMAVFETAKSVAVSFELA
eukprot:TRINITY_DN705_c0_g7_i1.p1 TRINITY_DN705_c0_g7~~TRINITY_DN705_c0_g7_i1.p1  ORF type:complete len:284 (+),score=84.20 TRINITY_DN705_c0_g7_i1:151-1002(+)